MVEKEDAEGSPAHDETARAPELSPGPVPTELDRLRAELEEAEREKGQFKNLAQRVQADFVNFRRQADEAQVEFQRSANAQIILKLLPILDDLERAAGHGAEGPAGAEEGWLMGVRLIARKFLAVVEEAGAQRMEALDKPFDPWEHEAVSYEETAEQPDGQVLAVVREGYKLHGKVIRPAMVTIAKAPQSESQEESPA